MMTLFLLTIIARADMPGLARLYSASHGVTVERTGASSVVRGVELLQPSDKIVVPGGATATLWCKSSTGRWLLKGPSSTVWDGKVLQWLSGNRALATSRGGDAISKVIFGREVAGGGYRVRGSGTTILPSGGLVRVPDSIEWRVGKQAKQYKVSITDPETGKELWSEVAARGVNRLRFPAGIATPGRTLSITVTAFEDDDLVESSQRSFRVFSSEDNQAVLDALQDLKSLPEDFDPGTRYLLQADVFEHYMLYSDALASLKKAKAAGVEVDDKRLLNLENRSKGGG
ncbi:MAG: hypothetical protein JSS72_10745 [Armatimonadetes bacterium]|nr:hypothetical protein [Armatimonadota bacterium]